MRLLGKGLYRPNVQSQIVPQPRPRPREQKGRRDNRADVVDCRCWCEKTIVKVERAELLAGFTKPCKRDTCQRINARKRSR